jgi:hypothetical protein
VSHVPVLPAQSATVVRLGCFRSYGSSYQTTVSLPGSFAGPALSVDVAQLMAGARSDLTYDENGFQEASAGSARALDALRLIGSEPALFNELVGLLLRVGNGGEALGDYLAGEPAALARLNASALSTAVPQTALALLSRILNTPAARSPGALSLVTRACGVWKGPAAIELWFKALGVETASDSLRDEIVSQCRPGEQQIVDSFERSRSRSPATAEAAAMDALQSSTFAALLKRKNWLQWQRREPLRLLARRTNDVTKLDALAAAITSPEENKQLALSLAQAPENSALSHKQTVIAGIVAKLDAADQSKLLVSLVQLGDEVVSPSMRAAIAKQALAHPATAERLRELLDTASEVFMPHVVLERSLAGKLDLVSFMAFNAKHLGSCRGSISGLRECATALEAGGAAFKGPLRPDFVASLQPLFTEADDVSLSQTTAIARSLGLKVEPIADAVCGREVEKVSTRGGASRATLLILDEIAPGNACQARVSRAELNQALGNLALAVLALALLAVPGVLLFHGYRKQWQRLRPALVAAVEAARESEGGVISAALADSTWSSGFGGALRKVREELLTADDGAAGGVVGALEAVIENPTLTERARSTAIEALWSGQVQSFLARCEGVLAYVLIFPAKHEDPKGLRRHAPFRKGWVEHLTELRRLLATRGELSLPILSVLVFVSSDASDGSVIVGYDDGRTSLLPGPVVEESEGRASGVRRVVESQRLMLERAFG